MVKNSKFRSKKILQESNKTNIQSEITEDWGCCYKKIKEIWDFRPVVLSTTILEIAVAEQDIIDTSIKSLMKALQDNKGIEEYAREAIQRLKI